jgi:hypothetical protein
VINSPNLQIAIPFVQVESLNPNIGEANFEKSQEIYFMNICTCFISIRKHNPDIKLRLFTNKQIPSKFHEILQENRVTITISPFTFSPPAEYGNLFRGCFYIFDAISNIEESTLFLDPDMICIKKIDFQEVQKNSLQKEIGVFDPGFSNEKKINGLTHNEAIEIYNSLMGTSYLPNRHLGGECFFLPISLRDSLMLDFRNFWLRATQEKNMQKNCFLTTEEHILSVITLELPSFSLDHHVARIWTTKTYRKIEGSQALEQLTFWHLPSEKSRGLLDIFHFISTHEKDYESYSETEEIEFLKKALKLNFLSLRNLISQALSKLKLISDWLVKNGS